MALTKIKENQIYILIAGSVLIALILTGISLWLYGASGTQQLDLSRPGYKKLQAKVDTDPISQSFLANGPMSLKEIEKFKALYNSAVDKAIKADAFSGDPLNPESLGIMTEGE